MAKKNGKAPNLKLEGTVSQQITRVKTLESIGRVPSSPSLNINRTAYTVSQFNEDFVPIPTKSAEKIEKFKPDISKKAWIRRLRSLFPITIWLPEYNLREYLFADILVGITIAIFQVPQSMGYCLIAQVPPVYGLYSSFFPALLYSILGTGYHCAFGPFAIVSGVMTGAIVVQVMHELGKELVNTKILATDILSETTTDKFENLHNIDIAIMVAFIIGVYILVFGICQLGFISNFMSEELISGFTTSASIIVFFSQLRYLLGVDLSHFSGPFNLIYGFKEVFERLAEVNIYTLEISGICIAVLLTFKLGVNRLTAKMGIKTPFPIELLVVIGGTLASNYLELNKAPYNVKIVGTIGNKFPEPLLPKFALFEYMWDKCIATAIVGYTITLSVCKIYGKKHGYKTDPNQEMIAMGATNIFSAFFQCIPAAASLPRSALQETAGGKTQVVSLVNCCCIVVVILALGKYLEGLPICVLGSCISVALVSLINRIGEFRRFWKVSKLDGMIWIITFLGVIIISVDYGIYLGLLMSLVLLIYKSTQSKVYLLGTVNDLDIYVPINKFNKVKEPDGFKIFQMCGALNFSNVEYFISQLENKCDIDVSLIKKYMKTKEFKSNVEEIKTNSYDELSKIKLIRLALNERLPKYLIIDCSMFSFIDFTGISTLKKTIQTYEEIGIQTVLSGVHVHIESMFQKEGFFDDISRDYLYKTIHDAVIFLQDIQVSDDSINDENESQKDFKSQMDSERNSFKSMTISVNNYSLNEEDIPEFRNDSHDIRIPRANPYSAEATPPVSRSMKREDNLSSSSPAICSQSYDSINQSFAESHGTSTAPSTPAPDFDTNEDILTPDSNVTEVFALSPTPMNNNIPFPPPLPTISNQKMPNENNIPIPPPPPPPPLPEKSYEPEMNEPGTSKSNTNQRIPRPPPLPSNSGASMLPLPPPLPSIDYNISPKSTVILKMNTKDDYKDNGWTGKKQPFNFPDPLISKRRVSTNLKARQEMLAKVLENNKISDA